MTACDCPPCEAARKSSARAEMGDADVAWRADAVWVRDRVHLWVKPLGGPMVRIAMSPDGAEELAARLDARADQARDYSKGAK